MKNSNDNIGNRTRDLSTCSATASPRLTERKPEHWPSDAWFSKFLLPEDSKWLFKVFILSFHAGITGEILQGPHSLQSRLMGLFTTISHETSFQWCCRLWSCYGEYNRVHNNIFFLGIGNSWTTCFWNNGYDEVDRQHGLFFSPIQIRYISFYLWGHLKSAVCVTEVSDVQNLEQRIQNGSEVIRTKRGIFQRVRQSLFRRATACFEAQGGHWEFSCSLPETVTVTRKPRLVRPIVAQLFFFVLWRRFNFCRSCRAHFLRLVYAVGSKSSRDHLIS